MGKAEAQKIQTGYEFEDKRRGHQENQSQGSPSGRILDLVGQHCASFEERWERYHQIWMDEEDAEKTSFIKPWGIYYYKMMSFVLKKFFDWLRKYNLKLNPAKCAFGVPVGKLLGFIINHPGIELDPSKVKAIQDFPSPKNKKDVMSF
uniref:Uncharacterized protein LOC104217605 n=1 Tax=Nicotiana sylvestris TaxID=4096 RepID=A0A1U7VW76_NICSY|nr:PREDICTED: uncharacterized protein LOC104217605 [Nicotiana sylvestris]